MKAEFLDEPELEFGHGGGVVDLRDREPLLEVVDCFLEGQPGRRPPAGAETVVSGAVGDA